MDGFGLALLEIDCRWPFEKQQESLPLLTPDIQARAARYLCADSRRNLIVSRTRLRQALEMLGLDQGGLSTADNGRPYHAEQKLQFNLSHSHDRAFLALSRDPALLEGLGVDVEWTERQIDVVGIGRRFFGPDEHRWVERDRDRFFHVWTRKEAVLKSNGVGLRVELAGFDVLGEQVEAQVSGCPLRLTTRRRDGNYLVSWALSREPAKVEIVTDSHPDWQACLRHALG